MLKPQCILMDIEGTTTPINFVHEVLFPYALAHLPAFLQAQQGLAEVRQCLAEVEALMLAERGDKPDFAGCLAYLERAIREDRKLKPLKQLQGLVWEAGFRQKAFVSPLYGDVVPAWQSWQKGGIRLAIYSSGSVQAQKLLFAHTEQGDVSSYLTAFFDTTVGAKQEPASYRQISEALELPPAAILFLSDVVGELKAAATAELKVCQLLRPGTQAQGFSPAIASFAELPTSSWFHP